MSTQISNVLPRAVAEAVNAFTGSLSDLDPVIELIGDARIVLLGEASHGTHEFYALRAAITKRLIVEEHFDAVAVEADWPDALRVSRYVRGASEDVEATEALGDFRRFPSWMWRNADVLDFVGWLREFNDALPAARRIGFYGLDLYSLHASMEAVLEYLERVDPPAAERARRRYSCFDHFGDDPQTYGYAASVGMTEPCRDDVVRQLIEMQQKATEYVRRDGRIAQDEYFFAEQNARLATAAEQYYRTMFEERNSTWNLRDTHMADTLDALARHIEKQRGNSRVVVWEHNSHLGDARATDMSARGEVNVGQLVRERWGDDVANIGFTTHTGTVTAATNWGGDAERKRVRPSLDDSYERVFHETGVPAFFLNLRTDSEAKTALRRRRLERAIGVIYRPQTERISHYFHAELPAQFDGVIHIDHTRALEPLEKCSDWERGELPETYPSGI
jgi:erythromycin esterase-like protein